MKAQPINPDPLAHPNPFDSTAVSDERWQNYIARYLAERHKCGGDENADEADESEQL